MKKVFLLYLVIPVSLYSQVRYDFESGVPKDWVQSTEDHWIADTMNSISGVYSLHHSFDNLYAGNDQSGILVRNLRPEDGLTVWSFKIRYGSEPSSSNNWCFFLMSDKPPRDMIPEYVTGYTAGVNIDNYDDTLRLWKVAEGRTSVVINSGINWQNDIGTDQVAFIEIQRSRSGEWSMSVRKDEDIQSVISTGNDPELFNTGWLGIFYRYTPTRDRLLWVDDIRIDGVFINDTLPPVVTGCKALNRNTVQLVLNEEVDYTGINTENFLLDDGIPAKSFDTSDKGSIIIEFNNTFVNKSMNRLSIVSLCDRSGNCSGFLTTSFAPSWAEPGDVIISEIMADPLPAVSLPGFEYVEITNRTGYVLELNNWKLSGNGQSNSIPVLEMAPHEIIIFCSDDNVSQFTSYGETLGIKQFPVLTDGGKQLVLLNDNGDMIHGVEYSEKWYGDKLKEAGGWSLEMIDTDFPFSGEDNWKASGSATGGTPGKRNSVSGKNPDIFFEGIINLFPVDSMSLAVRFSEPVFDLPGLMKDRYIGGNRIINTIGIDLMQREFILLMETPLKKNKLYTFNPDKDITDFAGNRPERNSFIFGLPEPAGIHDIMFNELLFNPLQGYPDYIELNNFSDHILNASELYLVSVNDASGDTSVLLQVSAEQRCILPGAFYTITTDKEMIGERYFYSEPDNIFESVALPSMPDNSGHLILYNRKLVKIDEVFYDEKMHFPLLSDNEGVSLEKVRPGISSADLISWHSASESSGWGTPGAPNSVFDKDPVNDGRISLSGTRISPDSDGVEDVLIIKMNPGEPGTVTSVIIYDETGRIVRKLAVNILIGEKGDLVWDGTIDDGSVAEPGIYIILINFFDDHGKTDRRKMVCAVVR